MASSGGRARVQVGAAFLASALVGGPLLVACVQYPIVIHRDVMDDRSSVAPLAVAPPPPGARRVADLTVRQLFATLVDGPDAPRVGASAASTIRTDLAIGVRLARYVGFRVLGSADYGGAVGTGPSPIGFPGDAVGTVGAGLIGGRWGLDQSWSLHVELDTLVTIGRSREQWGHEEAVCTGPAECGPFRRVSTTTHEGDFLFPAMGLSVDAAGEVLPEVRLGGGLSIQSLVVRDDGAAGWVPVGTARLFLELRVEDVSLVVEVQQAVSTELVFAPFLAIALRGAAIDGPGSDPRLDDDERRRLAEERRVEVLEAAHRARWVPPEPTSGGDSP